MGFMPFWQPSTLCFDAVSFHSCIVVSWRINLLSSLIKPLLSMVRFSSFQLPRKRHGLNLRSSVACTYEIVIKQCLTWHLDPSSHQTTIYMGRKLGGGSAPLGGGPHLTQGAFAEAYLHTPSFILIYPTVWPQYATLQTGQTDRTMVR